MSKSGWRLQLVLAAVGYIGLSALLDSGLPDALYALVRPLSSGLVSFFLIIGLMGADRERSITTTLPRAVMMRIGNASYTFYLVHWFVLSIMGKLIGVVPRRPLMALAAWHVLSILTAIVVAVVLAQKIELPFHRYLLARFGQMGSTSAPRVTVNSGSWRCALQVFFRSSPRPSSGPASARDALTNGAAFLIPSTVKTVVMSGSQRRTRRAAPMARAYAMI